MHGAIFLKMPINKDKIVKKDIRIMSIYPGILKDGSKKSADDSTHYYLDDLKKVPVEEFNYYRNVISDYQIYCDKNIGYRLKVL